jgi:hypothetical protein
MCSGCVLAYGRGMCGIKRSGFMIEDADARGQVFRKSHLGQRTIARTLERRDLSGSNNDM